MTKPLTKAKQLLDLAESSLGDQAKWQHYGIVDAKQPEGYDQTAAELDDLMKKRNALHKESNKKFADWPEADRETYKKLTTRMQDLEDQRRAARVSK